MHIYRISLTAAHYNINSDKPIAWSVDGAKANTVNFPNVKKGQPSVISLMVSVFWI